MDLRREESANLSQPTEQAPWKPNNAPGATHLRHSAILKPATATTIKPARIAKRETRKAKAKPGAMKPSAPAPTGRMTRSRAALAAATTQNGNLAKASEPAAVEPAPPPKPAVRGTKNTKIEKPDNLKTTAATPEARQAQKEQAGMENGELGMGRQTRSRSVLAPSPKPLIRPTTTTKLEQPDGVKTVVAAPKARQTRSQRVTEHEQELPRILRTRHDLEGAPPPQKPDISEIVGATPKARRTRKQQAEEDKEAPTEQGAEITATTPDVTLQVVSVLDHEPAPSALSKVAPRSRRPKAADFYETLDTPVKLTRGPASITTTAKPRRLILPEMAPQIPWELYGISDTSDKSDFESGAAVATEKDKKGRLAGKGKKETTQGISRQLVPSPWLRDTSPERDMPPPPAAGSRIKDHFTRRELDPHDKSMDADYIPTGPGPLPWIPKLPKGQKKRPKKQRPPPLAAKDQTKASAIPEAEDTPYPGPSAPPPTLLAMDYAAEAYPGIWNLGPNQSPQRWIRNTPARQGDVYCETCFRDELARWTRIRDGVIRILHLLGGDAALQELRTLAQEAEAAEKHMIAANLASLPEEGGSRTSLKSPPPPEYAPSSSESEDERPEGRVTANRATARPTDIRDWDSPLFNEYPTDIIGLVLLRIMADRPTSSLSASQRDEVNGLLDSLRQDVGVGTKFVEIMARLCKGMIVPWRMAGQPRVEGGKDSWWWEFDEALQAADRQLSVAQPSCSFFATTLAEKARGAAVAALTVKEAATAQSRDTSAQAGSLEQVKETLGMTMPSNLFLKSIGDKLARARRNLQEHANTPPPPRKQKRPRSKNNNDSDSDSAQPPPKRRKPNQPTNNQTTALRNNNPNPNPTSPATPLPCINCSKSTAATLHHQRQHSSSSPHPFFFTNDDPTSQTWINPLLWAFHLDLETATTRVRKAGDWFRFLLASRRVGVVDVFGHHNSHGLLLEEEGEGEDGGGGGGDMKIRFMVDFTGARTRVVLVEMRGAVEVILGRPRSRRWRQRVRFERKPLPLSPPVVLGAARP
ncbi:hypothetical protein C8A00DRAFT_38317, partial [Chaetomidium leptoderma]